VIIISRTAAHSSPAPRLIAKVCGRIWNSCTYSLKHLDEVKGLALEGFASVQAIAHDTMDSTAQAREVGIRAARSPVVVLTEDHSLPEPGWAEALIQAHQDGWSVVGPAVGNANPWSVLSWANFLIEYYECGSRSGAVRHPPATIARIKRMSCSPTARDLSRWLEAESLLHWDLGQRAQALPGAGCPHTSHEFSRFGASLMLRFQAGRLFGGMRRRTWGSCGVQSMQWALRLFPSSVWCASSNPFAPRAPAAFAAPDSPCDACTAFSRGLGK
jgi:hypothetical protein